MCSHVSADGSTTSIRKFRRDQRRPADRRAPRARALRACGPGRGRDGAVDRARGGVRPSRWLVLLARRAIDGRVDRVALLVLAAGCAGTRQGGSRTPRASTDERGVRARRALVLQGALADAGGDRPIGGVSPPSSQVRDRVPARPHALRLPAHHRRGGQCGPRRARALVALVLRRFTADLGSSSRRRRSGVSGRPGRSPGTDP
jgi:hypothetical protein